VERRFRRRKWSYLGEGKRRGLGVSWDGEREIKGGGWWCLLLGGFGTGKHADFGIG
jgi:hypothetical protein